MGDVLVGVAARRGETVGLFHVDPLPVGIVGRPKDETPARSEHARELVENRRLLGDMLDDLRA